ncbi:MAG: 50S ribosomal protein L9 [Anaerolineae bacterium]
MEVLLIKDVAKLGHAGDTVRVADGYARNYLLPLGLATTMNEGAKKQARDLQEARTRREQRVSQEASAVAARANGITLTFKAHAGEQGKLYGSVTTADIAEQLQAQHGVEVDRRRIELTEPLREVGQYTVEIKFAPKAVARVTVMVEGME